MSVHYLEKHKLQLEDFLHSNHDLERTVDHK